jgi:predicted DsbA family dithiol-disulfide isomerase
VKSARRDLLVIGAVIGAVLGLRAIPWNSLSEANPTYAEIEGLAPFRRLEAGGAVSGASVATIGLDAPQAKDDARRSRKDAIRSELCVALFGADRTEGTLPIAYFSEFRCPICRALEGDLDTILREGAGSLRLVQHELPIFGPSSELAARASVAAARQGLQQPLRRRFMRSALVADEASILAVAAGIGIDPDRLLKDMTSGSVQDDLDRTRALADLFGFAGTPVLVIGRTIVEGAVSIPLLRRVIADERALPDLSC